MSHRWETQARGLAEIKASTLFSFEVDAASEDTKHIFSDAEQNFEKRPHVIPRLA